jgi:hypothetical protein
VRRRTLLVALAGLAALAVALYLLSNRPSVTLQSYQRLRMGMTWKEITSTLGPPGDYTTCPTVRTSEVLSEFSWPPNGVREVVRWDGDDVSLDIGVDAFGRLVGCQCRLSHRLEQSRLDNIRWLVRRQWHRWFP